VQSREISALKEVKIISDWMSYIILRGRLCSIIFINVHNPSEDKTECEGQLLLGTGTSVL
jgi:hypothetical protein